MSNTPMSVEVQNHAQAVDGKGNWGHSKPAMTPEQLKARTDSNNAKGCKIASCTKDMTACSHGVCRTHYKMLLKMVRSNATTWQALEAQGITDPATYTRDPRDRDILMQMIQSKA